MIETIVLFAETIEFIDVTEPSGQVTKSFDTRTAQYGSQLVVFFDKGQWLWSHEHLSLYLN